MASVTEKNNGKCVIRVFCGTDEHGHKVVKSKTFTPSSPNLSYSKYHKELTHFTKLFEEECQDLIEKGLLKLQSPSKMPFSAFCEKYLEIQEKNLAPETLHFYRTVINTHLIPMYGKLMISDIKVRHIQDYIVFLSKKKKPHSRLEISPATVKRYTTVCFSKSMSLHLRPTISPRLHPVINASSINTRMFIGSLIKRSKLKCPKARTASEGSQFPLACV